MNIHRSSILMMLSAGLWLGAGAPVFAQTLPSVHKQTLQCNEAEGIYCAEQAEVPGYEYVGHDEPSVLFYSNRHGSGYNNIWRARLPKEPPTLPQQDGKGGVWNFQLHPAWWFGMAMCDSESSPNYTKVCLPDTDANIFDSGNPNSPRYIGKHPGTAFMEMQFYPPGWITGNSATQWTAALNIDSVSQDGNTGRGNNAACGGAIEYVNFAFIQLDGVPAGPPSPLLSNGDTFTVNSKTLFMNPGDELEVLEFDTAHGLKIVVRDLTTGQSGFMVASAANGFGQILFDPNGANCDPATHNIPYDFHPMYATSSEHTRVPWAAHSYNIAFADETGHFEYCSTVAAEGGACLDPAPNDPPGLDDAFCFDAGFAASFGLLGIGGCVDGDADFDGVPYRSHTWPGTLPNVNLDRQLHAQPIQFSSPLFFTGEEQEDAKDFERVAFEADLPRIETNTNPICQRHVSNPADPSPGAACVDPPAGADFYPFFTTTKTQHGCRWQLGGPYLPHTVREFGGSAKAEYGGLLALTYPGGPGGLPTVRYNDFRRVLSDNPCRAGSHDD